MRLQYESLYSGFNNDQVLVFNEVITATSRKEGGMFFVYGSGGCGKTYLWRTMIAFMRSENYIVLPVASSGIASTLLLGVHTSHSRFGIHIVLDDISTCSITVDNERAGLLWKTSLIIWDEAPMHHRYAFEALDRTLKDVMKFDNPNAENFPFGGITVVLGGDVRQILPVISRGNREDIVTASINRSKLWASCKVFILKQNMRLTNGYCNRQRKDIQDFGSWVLRIGDGKITNVREEGNDESSIMEIPKQFVLNYKGNGIDVIINSTYPDLSSNFSNDEYLRKRSILTPKNETVESINAVVLSRLLGHLFVYNSSDSIVDGPGTKDEMDISFPVEFSNALIVIWTPESRC